MSDLANVNDTPHGYPPPMKLNDRVTVSGNAADLLREHFGPVFRHIAKTYGHRAFENPFSSTVVHEAGHAVVYAFMGAAVTTVSVRKLLFGKHRGQWTGFTEGGPKLQTDSTTDPKEDFKQACMLMAGVISEIIFDTDNFREGSSLDEAMQAYLMGSNISIKTGAPFEYVMKSILNRTHDVLKSNSVVVLEIADLLKRKKRINKPQLDPILARVPVWEHAQ
jgi:hypothetical protein